MDFSSPVDLDSCLEWLCFDKYVEFAILHPSCSCSWSWWKGRINLSIMDVAFQLYYYQFPPYDVLIKLTLFIISIVQSLPWWTCEWIEREKILRDSNPRFLVHDLWALPLSYNCYPNYLQWCRNLMAPKKFYSNVKPKSFWACKFTPLYTISSR